MAQRRDHIELATGFPLGGLNSTLPASMLNPRLSPKLSNVLVRDGVLAQRPGYAKLASGLPNSTQPVVWLKEFKDQLVAATLTDFWLYDGSGQWNIMGLVLDGFEDSSGWTAEANVTLSDESTIKKLGTNSMKIEVADGFTTGKLCSQDADFTPVKDFVTSSWTNQSRGAVAFWFRSNVELNAGDIKVYISEQSNGGNGATFASIDVPAMLADTWTFCRVANAFTDCDAILSVGIWQAVDKDAATFYIDSLRALDVLTGDLDDAFDSTEAEDASWGEVLLVTNGQDYIRTWDGSSDDFERPDLSDYTGLTAAKTIATLRSHLVVGNTKVSGSWEPQNIAWSDVDNYDEWTLGSAGDSTFQDMQGEILLLLPFGSRLIAYAKSSISEVRYVGGSVIYSFSTVCQDVGVLGPRAAIAVGPYHIFVGRENVYLFDGSCVLRELGDPIKNEIRDGLSYAHRARCHGFFSELKREAWIAVPTGALTNFVLHLGMNFFDVSNLQWTKHSFVDPPFAFGDYTLLAFSLVFGSSLGSVMLLDESSEDDDDAPLVSSWETLDFSMPEAYLSEIPRWLEIELEAKGDLLKLEYSVDQGSTWSVIDSGETLSAVWTRYRWGIDVTTRLIRFRLTNSTASSSFSFRWLRLWFSRGGTR